MEKVRDNLLDFSLFRFIAYYDTKKETCIMIYFEGNKKKKKKVHVLV